MGRTKNLLIERRGAGKYTTLVFALLTGVTLYCAYYIIPFYYYYYELQNQFEAHVRVGQAFNDRQIREKLMYHIDKMQIPMKPQDLKIDRADGKIRISLTYQEVFYVTFKDKDYTIKTFDFTAYAEAPIN